MPAGGAHRLRLEPADERGRAGALPGGIQGLLRDLRSTSSPTRPPRPWPTSSCPTPPTWSASTRCPEPAAVLGRPGRLGLPAPPARRPAPVPAAPFSEVLLEIGERLGIADAMNARINDLYGLRPPHALNPERALLLGGDRRPHLPGLVRAGARAGLVPPERRAHLAQAPGGGLLEALRPGPRPAAPRVGCPDWRPCRAQRPQIGFDLQAVSYQVPWHTASQTCENPWLDEVSQSEPYSYFICLNPRTAAARGIADGDPIWVESTAGPPGAGPRPPERGRPPGGSGHRRQRRSLGARHARGPRAGRLLQRPPHASTRSTWTGLPDHRRRRPRAGVQGVGRAPTAWSST